jgi:uncharacterized C2H2 Zn-finger protein
VCKEDKFKICKKCGKKYKYIHNYCRDGIKKEVIEKKKTHIYECKKCGKNFKLEKTYNDHLLKANCHLTLEERKALRNKRFKETMNNKTKEEKEKISKKLSKNISKARQSKTEEEKKIHNEKVSNGLKEYYKSDRYDFESKSKNIKKALYVKNN